MIVTLKHLESSNPSPDQTQGVEVELPQTPRAGEKFKVAEGRWQAVEKVVYDLTKTPTEVLVYLSQPSPYLW